MSEGRPLEAIRSDLRGAKAFAISHNGNKRLRELLAEARQQCPDGDTWRNVLAELEMSERDV